MCAHRHSPYEITWWQKILDSPSTLYISLPLIAGNLLSLWIPNPFPSETLYLLIAIWLTIWLTLQFTLRTYLLFRLHVFHLEVPLLLLCGFCLHNPRFPMADLPPIPEVKRAECYLEIELHSGGKTTAEYLRYSVELLGYYADSCWHTWPTKLTLCVDKLDSSVLRMQPGQRYLVRGKTFPIKDSSDNFFSYRRWATYHGIAGTIYTGVANLLPLPSPPLSFDNAIALSHQRAIAKFCAAGIDKEALGPVVAMTIGDRSALSTEMNDSFRNCGLAHILAISGFHVGIVYSILYLFAMLLAKSNYWAYALRNALPILFIWAFAVYCGLAPPIVRASIVVTIYALGKLLGAPMTRSEIYFASAACVMVVDPIAPVDVGFYLSFLAVAGILIFLPYFSSIVHTGLRWVDKLLALLLVSIAAQLGTTPLVLAAFESLPIVGIIASLPAGLLSYPIVVLGLAVALLPTGCMVSQWLGYPLQWSAKSLIWVGRLGSSLNPTELSQLDLPLSFILTLSLSIGLLGLYAIYRHRALAYASLTALGASLLTLWI